jgi:hypothetical protein
LVLAFAAEGVVVSDVVSAAVTSYTVPWKTYCIRIAENTQERA